MCKQILLFLTLAIGCLWSVADAQVIQMAPGPFTANDAGEGIEIITTGNDFSDWLTTISAGGTLYIGFTWTVESNADETGTGGFFGGLGFYDANIEKLLVGNSWNSLNFGIAGQGSDESSTIPYVIGTPSRLVVKLTIVDGTDPDTAELFVDQAAEGAPDAVNVIAIDNISRILSRAGNAGGIATITDVTVALDFTSAAAAAFDSDGDHLPDASFEQRIIDAAATEDPPRVLSLSDIKGPNDEPETSDYDMDMLTDADEFAANTDPINPDTDEDGVDDGPEIFTYGTSPLNPDTDGDGLSDGEEVNTYDTDPTLVDTDSDGFSDPIEISSGSDPDSDLSTPSVLKPADQLGVTDGGAGRTVIDPATMQAYLGGPADDSYTGKITYSAAIEFTELANGTGESGFAGLQIFQGNEERLGVGDQWNNTNWSGYRAPPAEAIFTMLDSEGLEVPLAVNAPETITVTIDMVAGADDTITVLFRGAESTFTGPVDFDQLRVRCGNGDQTANFTNISFRIGEITGVIEISAIDHDSATGTTELTWDSEPDAIYRIDYSLDLNDWSGEVVDEIESAGDTTSFEFTLQTLALPADTRRLFFRIAPAN